jgi:predicted alpha/beta superfamily hydrolase
VSTRLHRTLALAFWLTAAPTVAAHAPAGTTVQTSIASQHTGVTYRLSIYLPPGHAQPQQTFPAIYAMDGDSRFERLKAVLQQNRIEAILVGVSCVSSERRRVDYTMPGATGYYRFLTRELIPFVETRYRARDNNRMLSGHSLSGKFVLLALFMEDPANRYFSSFISSDGSFWHQQQVIATMEEQMSRKTRRLSGKLVMSGAGNLHYVGAVYDDIRRRDYDGLQMKFLTYEGWGHVEMDAPSFNDGVKFLFGNAR